MSSTASCAPFSWRTREKRSLLGEFLPVTRRSGSVHMERAISVTLIRPLPCWCSALGARFHNLLRFPVRAASSQCLNGGRFDDLYNLEQFYHCVSKTLLLENQDQVLLYRFLTNSIYSLTLFCASSGKSDSESSFKPTATAARSSPRIKSVEIL